MSFFFFLFCSDFEFSFAKSSADAGFSLPDCIRLAPNLLNFSIQSDRNTAAASFRRTLRESHDIIAFTGGISLPDILITHCKKLRTLVFGVSCTVDDVSNFTSKLPDLISLTVNGEVDNTTFTVPFTTCGPRLRKLWLPTTSMGPVSLGRLSLKSQINSLAILFDIDDHYNPVPPTPESIQSTKAKLVTLFSKIGPNLLELSISTPFADQPDNNRMRLPMGLGGGMGGGGLGGLAQGGNIAMQIIHTVGGALGGALGGVQVNGVNLGGGAPAGPAGPVPPPPAAAAAAANGNGATPRRNGGGAPRGPAGAGGFQIPGIHLFGFNPVNVSPPTQFFEDLLLHCSSLVHLELYGRRYSTSLLSLLEGMKGLEVLNLSVPLDEDRITSGFELELKRVVKEGLVGLKRMELSGKGGEWTAVERRAIKEICEERGIFYSSTN